MQYSRTSGKSEILVTDYSSVHFDFAYMKKPCIYYQFDYDEFRKGHWQEGYFSYKKDAFGPVIDNERVLVECIDTFIQAKCQLEERYLKKAEIFFAYQDQDNCKRVYECISNISK